VRSLANQIRNGVSRYSSVFVRLMPCGLVMRTHTAAFPSSALLAVGSPQPSRFSRRLAPSLTHHSPTTNAMKNNDSQ
jgi:hypothetical protein